MKEIVHNNKKSASQLLREAISKSFNSSDFTILTSDLEIEIENLSGTTKDEKIVALLKKIQQENKLDQMLGYLVRERPNENWYQLFDIFKIETIKNRNYHNNLELFYHAENNTLFVSSNPYNMKKQLLDYKNSHIQVWASLSKGRRLLNIKTKKKTGIISNAISKLNLWLESTSMCLALLGEPGSGKTFLLRQFCSILSKSNRYIPVFISANQFLKLSSFTRQDLLILSEPPIPNECVLDLKNVILIIDGLDELIILDSKEQDSFSIKINTICNLIPENARFIFSCRSSVFEVTNDVISKALIENYHHKRATDKTDNAIQIAIGIERYPEFDTLEMIELTKAQSFNYLTSLVGKEYANNPAAKYVIENLPRVPVILRFLQLALPEFHHSTGKIDLDELYSAAIKAWILRDPAFAGQNKVLIWNKLLENHFFGSVELQDEFFVSQLLKSGLLKSSPNGKYIWSHNSINEFFFAVHLFSEINRYNSKTLSRIDLIGLYNVNRFIVPMCQRELKKPFISSEIRLVSGNEYCEFLNDTGWRKNSGYGLHPSYYAKDGTGFISGIENLNTDRYIRPNIKPFDNIVSGISWYDAFAYCLWSGEMLPDSRQFNYDSSLDKNYWYWCIDWLDERKAHIALVSPLLKSNKSQKGGANPDFRNNQIALATIRINKK
jgi:DNA replication protein DnaC